MAVSIVRLRPLLPDGAKTGGEGGILKWSLGTLKKMAVGKRFSRATFEILLKGEGLGFIGETQVADEIPRFVASGMNRFAGIVVEHSNFQILGLAHIPLISRVNAFDEIDVMHEA